MDCGCVLSEAHRCAEELCTLSAFYRELRRDSGYPCACDSDFHDTRQTMVRVALANVEDIRTTAQGMERILGGCLLTNMSCEDIREAEADVYMCSELQGKLRKAIVAIHGYVLGVFETFSRLMRDEEACDMDMRTRLLRDVIEDFDPPEENRPPPYSPRAVVPSHAADEDDEPPPPYSLHPSIAADDASTQPSYSTASPHPCIPVGEDGAVKRKKRNVHD